jgi:hypothetical protein
MKSRERGKRQKEIVRRGNKERGFKDSYFRGHLHTYRTTGYVRPYAYGMSGVLSTNVMDTVCSHVYILSVLYGADLFLEKQG